MPPAEQGKSQGQGWASQEAVRTFSAIALAESCHTVTLLTDHRVKSHLSLRRKDMPSHRQIQM